MEVNLSPSLACDSPIDLKIKHQLLVDTLNLACLRKYDRRRDNLNKIKTRQTKSVAQSAKKSGQLLKQETDRKEGPANLQKQV